MNGEEQIELDEELDYYQLSSLRWKWNWNPNKNIELSSNDTIAKKMAESYKWDSTVVGNKPMDSFSVKLIQTTETSCAMIGLAPSTVSINGNRDHYGIATCGW